MSVLVCEAASCSHCRLCFLPDPSHSPRFAMIQLVWHDDKLNPVFDSTKDCYISRWNNSPQPREICSGRVACLNLAGGTAAHYYFQKLLKTITLTKNFVGTGSEMVQKFVTSEISTCHFDDISILMWPGSGFACLQCRDLIGSKNHGTFPGHCLQSTALN